MPRFRLEGAIFDHMDQAERPFIAIEVDEDDERKAMDFVAYWVRMSWPGRRFLPTKPVQVVDRPPDAPQKGAKRTPTRPPTG